MELQSEVPQEVPCWTIAKVCRTDRPEESSPAISLSRLPMAHVVTRPPSGRTMVDSRRENRPLRRDCNGLVIISNWLPRLGSNQGLQIQRLLCYHCTTGQRGRDQAL